MRRYAISAAYFQGAITLQTVDGGLKPWRLIHPELALFTSPDEAFAGRAETAAGVRLRVATDSPTLVVQLAPMVGPGRFDLVRHNVLLATVDVPAGATEVAFANLPGGHHALEVWLPQAQPVVVRALVVDDAATLAPAADTRRRWVTYGSSITHCGAAHSPSRTWPATVARQHDLHLTALGYGGQCHLDIMVGRMIRDLPADLITLKLGINIQGSASLNARTFKTSAIGFVKLIREKHPTTPIGIISPIVSPPRETGANPVGMSLVKMRDDLADAVARLRASGDANIHYFDGLDAFPLDQVAALMPDQLHPNGDGYELMGRRIADLMVAKLLG